MKKLIAIAVVALCVMGAVFAQSSDWPTGKWLDSKWNGVWEFGSDKAVKLYSTDGSLIFDFTGKMVDYKLTPSTSGLTLSFRCPETYRAYSFKKPLTLSSDLELTVDPDWSSEDYKTNITFQKLSF